MQQGNIVHIYCIRVINRRVSVLVSSIETVSLCISTSLSFYPQPPVTEPQASTRGRQTVFPFPPTLLGESVHVIRELMNEATLACLSFVPTVHKLAAWSVDTRKNKQRLRWPRTGIHHTYRGLWLEIKIFSSNVTHVLVKVTDLTFRCLQGSDTLTVPIWWDWLQPQGRVRNIIMCIFATMVFSHSITYSCKSNQCSFKPHNVLKLLGNMELYLTALRHPRRLGDHWLVQQSLGKSKHWFRIPIILCGPTYTVLSG